jgi:NADPH:quinone reductase-like Zn-dependent oxidoreductase
MKAATRSRYGPPAVLHVADVAVPVPAADEVLVRVYATTVNRTDCANLTARPFIMRFIVGLVRPRRRTPGTDLAGVVTAVGTGVTGFAVGDRVWAFKDTGLSSQAEFTACKADVHVARMPEGISWVEAAASVEGTHYARNFMNKVTVVRGQSALVNGATGAIGSALVQFLVREGVRVTGVCDARGVERVRAMGAERVVDYEVEDVRRITSRFDYVFDAVGKSTFFRFRPLLLPHGVYVSSEFGPWLQNAWLSLLTPLGRGRRVAFPFPGGIADSLAFARARLEDGSFRPLIDRRYPLDRVREAYEYVCSGRKLGNVVLETTPSRPE